MFFILKINFPSARKTNYARRAKGTTTRKPLSEKRSIITLSGSIKRKIKVTPDDDVGEEFIQ